MDVLIRRYNADDLPDLVQLFRDTVHAINAKDYTPEQLNAWAPATIDAERWGQKLLAHYTLVAKINGVLCGFADIDDTGYFDHLFVHKNYQGKGIAGKLVAAIEAHALQNSYKRITVAVSITAKTFFLQKGYTIISPQQVPYNGQVFTNYFMDKKII
ncbi:GNAT family N-acetyltransferase [Flavobacterium rhizosphaerae]|uniref:GNAT family N-acetyltransferase n=1 Tax=Flavobacterium rhizosphaerae TaxID=3163298 RepID=A0ABW8YZJ4_9FLAO